MIVFHGRCSCVCDVRKVGCSIKPVVSASLSDCPTDLQTWTECRGSGVAVPAAGMLDIPDIVNMRVWLLQLLCVLNGMLA